MVERLALYSPNMAGGGAERVTLNIARELANRNIPTDLVLANAVGEYMNEIPDTVRVVDLASSGVIKSIPRLVRYLRRERPLAMLSNQMHANVIALIARDFAKSNTRIVVREANIVSLPADLKTRLRVRAIILLARLLYPRAKGVIAVSHGVARSLNRGIGLPIDRTNVIYNPVVRPELYERVKEEVNHPWFNDDGDPIILSVGRLEEQKDFFSLIQAFSLVNKNKPSRLVILGEGSQRSELENMIQELGLENVVSLPGFSNNPYAYMARASVYVLSSAWEGLPNTLIEAMAVGLPVVATDCESGPREILADGRYGHLSPVGDVEKLAEGILSALTDDDYPVADNETMMQFHLNHSVDKYLQALCG